MNNYSTIRLLRPYTILAFSLLLLVGCGDAEQKDTQSSSKNTKNQNTMSSDDRSFLLEEDGIRVVLPNGFKRYSAVQYQDHIKNSTKGKQYRYEEERFAQVRNTEGNLYIYYNEDDGTSYFVNTIPDLAMDDANAQALLNMVRGKHTDLEKETNRKYTKVTAKFNEAPGAKIFKSIYEVTAPDQKDKLWAHSYLINAADKTVYININTTKEQNFDSYIQQMDF